MASAGAMSIFVMVVMVPMRLVLARTRFLFWIGVCASGGFGAVEVGTERFGLSQTYMEVQRSVHVSTELGGSAELFVAT